MDSDHAVSLWVETLRGGLVESVSRVRAVALGPGQDGPETVLYQSGNPAEPIFWRSAAKFIQALSLVESGAADMFGLTDAELALACASHSGSDAHVEGVRRMLEKIGARPEDLHCAPHVPLGPPEAKQLAARGPGPASEPTRLHNNCSGKHTGMLAVCRVRGWPFADYNRLHHPLQQEILRHLSEVSDVPVEQIGTAVDGCGAVVFRTPLPAMARAYRRLLAGALPAPHQAAGQRLLQAMRVAPQMVAGIGRLCTRLIEVSGGRLVPKIGADGVYGLGMDKGSGYGLALKIEDGSGRIVEAVLCHLAAHLGWLSPEQLETLRPHWDLPIYNHQREQVGDVRVRFT